MAIAHVFVGVERRDAQIPTQNGIRRRFPLKSSAMVK